MLNKTHAVSRLCRLGFWFHQLTAQDRSLGPRFWLPPEVERPEPPKKKLGLQPLAEGPAFGAAPRSLPPVRSFMRMTAAGKSLMAEAILMKPFGKLRTTQTPARTTSRADQRPKQRKGHLNPDRVRGRIVRRLCRPIPAHTVIFTRSWEHYIWMRPS